jgi:RNA polymerase sigma-70 factor (ECF subfamily)
MAGSSTSEWVRAAVAEYEQPLLRYAMRLTNDLERARDVVQDTFLRLCRQPRADIEARLAQWLFTVCRNRALDVSRKESRMKPTSSTLPDVAPSDMPDPHVAMERNETVGRALELMTSLPRNQQEVLRLKFQQGLSYKEISGITQLTVSHVGVLIHNGLKTLRVRMGATPRMAPGA